MAKDEKGYDFSKTLKKNPQSESEIPVHYL